MVESGAVYEKLNFCRWELISWDHAKLGGQY